MSDGIEKIMRTTHYGYAHAKEIKEILDKLETVAGKHTIEVREDGSKIERMSAYAVNELRLNNFSSKILLDFITNLQEEIEYQKQAENEYNEKHLKLMNMYSDLKSRNEKALDKLYCYGEVFDRKILQDFQREMLDILGDDKDVKD